ncbi:MAG: type II toxin-antitoxin system VapC family toxin [Gammaproteobacteria bacterium]
MKKLSYLLDTNICIYIIKKEPKLVLNKFKQFSPGDIGISSVTLAELYYGVEKSSQIEKNRSALENFLLPLEILLFDDQAAIVYGEIRANLEKNGTPIGPLDLMIAAHTKSRGLTLVTNNTKEFVRIAGLLVENWVKA